MTLSKIKQRRKPIGLPLADLLYLRRRQIGLTQERLAMRLQRIAESKGSWSGATAQLIHRYEMGVTPRSDSLEWLALSLELSPETVREQARQQYAQLENTNSLPPSEINDREAAESVIDSMSGDGEVRRRELARVGFGALALVPGLDLEQIQAVLSGSRRVDKQSLDQLKTVTEALMQKSWNAEPQSLLPILASHFRSFGNILLQVPSKLSSSALSMAGEAAYMAGYISQKSGRLRDADFYWQTCEWMAKMAGNVRLQTTLLVSKGWRACEQNQLKQAMEAYNQAEYLLGRNHSDPVLAARTYSSHSYGFTATGQAQAADRDLDMADRYLKQLPGDDAPLYTLETIREEVAEARGWHLLHIGKYSEAASTFEQMLDRINPTWKSWQAIAKANLASVYAQQGNIEQAAHTFSSALHTAREAGAFRYEQKAFSLRQQWLGDNDSPVVRHLDEEFATTPLLSR